jgi:hypothetical protein
MAKKVKKMLLPLLAALAAIVLAYNGCVGAFQSAIVATSKGLAPSATLTPFPSASPTPSPTATATPSPLVDYSVTQHHKQATRAGFFVDPAFTKAAAANLRQDPNFTGPVTGSVYAQPLFYDAMGNGTDLLIVATEQNHVTALNAQTGAVVWDKSFGATASIGQHGCGNIDPLGITGTPALDATNKIVYFDAMVGGGALKHLIYALSLTTGATLPGWPVDVAATISGFNSTYQNQRSALLLYNGYLYVPYGGHWGDCGSYYGWIVAVPVNNPSAATGWHTALSQGGIWAPGGMASDGTYLYAVTGNTGGSSAWGQGEAVLKFSAPLSFSGASADYYSPTNWYDLDNNDKDLGGAGALLFDLASGASPQRMLLSLGKDGFARLMSRDNLGGIGNALASLCITSCIPSVALGDTPELITASTAFSTNGATYASFASGGAASICPQGQSGDLTTLLIKPGSPPQMTGAWCATQNGAGSPIATAIDSSGTQAIVWSIGAEGDNLLHGFDGATGAALVSAGTGNVVVQHFQTPIEAKGRMYVGGNGHILAFTLQ